MRTSFAFALVVCLIVSQVTLAAPPDYRPDADDPVRLRNWAVDISPIVMPRGAGRAGVETDAAIETEAVIGGASHFIAVVPCRVVDTRAAIGAFGGPPMTGGETRTFSIPGSACTGIPSNATAYSFNFTVTNTAAGGWLTVWPTGQTPPVVSTLNYLAGQTVANAAVVPAGSGGSIDVSSWPPRT